ncbi:Retrotransposable element Tf2 [Gossypium australe]|uniref:Retrotransposable element Tf2 n=1 Tax=Gossypium australe TaxID=47621 RepID=A0A5B6WI33_9ROSI|nr:Retrotransposable element Tf2 [Gossypium australe]
MYDASDFVIGAVLQQRKNKLFHAIYCASQTLTICISTKVIVYTDHSTIKYLVTKKDTKSIRKDTENQVVDHLSRLEVGNEDSNIQLIKKDFPDEHLLVATTLPWYADIVNFFVSGLLSPELNI